MLRKTFKLQKPLDEYAVPLELFLEDASKKFLQQASGEYTGNGKASRKITTSFSPQIVVVSTKVDTRTKDTLIAGNMVFALAANPGAAWLPGSGFKKDCILSFQNDGFTIGSNSNVNAELLTYIYYVIG